MKSLRSAVNWMSSKLKNKSGSEAEETSVDPAAPVADPVKNEDSGKLMAFVSTVQQNDSVQMSPVAVEQTPVQAPASPVPTQRVRRTEPVVEEPARRPMSLADLTSGPEVKVVTRGAKQYAVCPHCEAQWNIRERLSHPSFKRGDSTKGLTCPNCDKSVGLPAQTDLRKLS